MTDLEKLAAKTQKVLCVEEVTTKISYYNCFGDKIDEDVKTVSSFYTFKDKEEAENLNDIGWIKGQK